ncbi:MAG: sulfurtransferase TusA family protein [Betaproteobacteria bacterium]|nr:sulfurtransferase TusA family protein [Betaproteobacteria bacterium]
MSTDKEIDTSGLNCPLPILKAKKALAELQSGQTLKVIATDPGSWRDFEAFARQTGNALLSQEKTATAFVYVLQRR